MQLFGYRFIAVAQNTLCIYRKKLFEKSTFGIKKGNYLKSESIKGISSLNIHPAGKFTAGEMTSGHDLSPS